jgi:dTDP-glucose 4,6-dehydratase
MTDLSELRGTRAVLTGAAGFLGSHLATALVGHGVEVVAIDNLVTGNVKNLDHLIGEPGFRFVKYDVTDYLHVPGKVDWVMHFASPASPIDYLKMPIQTLKVGALGTHKALGLAMAKDARFLLASTSEVYGDPQVHPQTEDYWGHVNPIGPRGVYDEAKRYAEALTFAYHRHHGVEVRVARIFNCFGERMRLHDGRAVPNFITQAIAGEPLTVHGDGEQTRSLQYVSDLIRGFLALLVGEHTGPINIGNPHEVTMNELAALVIKLVGSDSVIEYVGRPVDDPQVRNPDITLAREHLGWEPEVTLEDGLAKTIDWFRTQLP